MEEIIDLFDGTEETIFQDAIMDTDEQKNIISVKQNLS